MLLKLIRYIHGGAWRDPLITSHSFIHFLKCLYSSDVNPDTTNPSPTLSSIAQKHIAGLASVSYRLSPHPSHPQNPSTTPSHELRHAKHPDHIEDVITAIHALQEKYRFGHRYVIVGHSCGATLGFQVAMCATNPWKNPSEEDDEDDDADMTDPKPIATDTASLTRSERDPRPAKVFQPKAIVGVEGIYDIPLLVSDYAEVPAYREFIEGAFGPERPENDDSKRQSAWQAASPARFGHDGFVERWANSVSNDTADDGPALGKGVGVLAMIAHSPEDELVNMRQVEAMEQCLRGPPSQLSGRGGGGTGGRGEIQYRFLELQGKHHEIWEKGAELARCVEEVVKTLFSPS